MDLELLISDIDAIQAKPGFSNRLNTVRGIITAKGGVINLESTDFSNHEDHDNHSDWDNRKRTPVEMNKRVKLKTITLKAVSEICGHTDHSDHNDFSDSREI